MLPSRLLNSVKPIGVRLLGLCPFCIQKTILEKVLNHIFAEPIADGDLDFLQLRYLEVKITDLQLGWCVSYLPGKLRIVSGRPKVDACISGTARSFILLASRQEDPDTLFFQRQLCIEGDTELGLATKNLLDTVDLSTLPPLLRQALDKLGGMATRST